MLRRGERLTCGAGGAAAAPAGKEAGELPPEAASGPLKPRAARGRSGRSRWRGRRRGGGRTQAREAGPPRLLLSLRPVNLLGQRAPGMRAPRNTNQFLMREKYRLLHLRSDSLGTESGGSDCEMDPLDMDSYLGVLENARGALLDLADAPRRSPPALPQEESLPYFPSEDDVMESETFMERDFQDFCSRIA